ncbi:MAG: radical SAM protein [Candidatus Omnitrophica bacterium]|nr:radical SAM protein [Candidatus Omnitrophota bacterium]
MPVGRIDKKFFIKALLFKGENQDALFLKARGSRNKSIFGSRIEVRSVIEFSNFCGQICNYCGMSRDCGIERYTLKKEEFLSRVGFIYNKGRRVIVAQSGEISSDRILMMLCETIALAKSKFPGIEFIGSFGNLRKKQLKAVKEAGVSRYILKFETSNPRLYKIIKPRDALARRIQCIRLLGELGFSVGTGNMIGLPGQTIEDIAGDLLLIKDLRLSMASTSVFIPHARSKFRSFPPGDIDMALNYIALMRISYPRLIIPSTSCLELLRKNGQYLGLMAGANAITIHDGTPASFKKLYTIYNLDRFQPDEYFVNRIVRKAKLKPCVSFLRKTNEDPWVTR